MKELVDRLHGISEKLCEIDKFMFVLGQMNQCEITRKLADKIKTKLDDVSDNIRSCHGFIMNYGGMNLSDGKKRFDIMAEDERIEIGLVADSADSLRKIYEQCGDRIQILREIDEYGMITNEHEPVRQNFCDCHAEYRVTPPNPPKESVNGKSETGLSELTKISEDGKKNVAHASKTTSSVEELQKDADKLYDEIVNFGKSQALSSESAESASNDVLPAVNIQKTGKSKGKKNRKRGKSS